MIKASKLSKYYGEHTVLRSLSFTIAPEHKVALTGFNGVGKSTLLKILAGEEAYSNGVLEIAPNTSIGYLPQDMHVHDDVSVKDFLYDTEAGVETDDVYTRNISIYFAGFLLDEIVLEKNFGELSSGEKTKVFLVKILLQQPSLLLLDEPTNNLDLAARIWLETYLKDADVACVIISHDAAFLNAVCNKIFEIQWDDQSLIVSNASYFDYLKEQQLQYESQEKQHKLDATEVKRLVHSAKAKQAKAEKGKKWKSGDNDKMLMGHKRNRTARSFKSARVTYNRIKRFDVTEAPAERDELSLSIDAADVLTPEEKTITLTDVVVGQGGFTSAPLTLEIPYGSALCIVGQNGIGKTSLLKTITGLLAPIKGEIAYHPELEIAHVMQEHESLPREKTVEDFLLEAVPMQFAEDEDTDVITVEVAARHKARIESIVEAHNFTHNSKKSIGVLSPGERLRLLFLYFSIQGVDVLVLDEPTNHLDGEALFALNDLLEEFEGTIITVSHDRKFIEENDFTLYHMTEEGIVLLPDFSEYVDVMEAKAKKLARMVK